MLLRLTLNSLCNPGSSGIAMPLPLPSPKQLGYRPVLYPFPVLQVYLFPYAINGILLNILFCLLSLTHMLVRIISIICELSEFPMLRKTLYNTNDEMKGGGAIEDKCIKEKNNSLKV